MTLWPVGDCRGDGLCDGFMDRGVASVDGPGSGNVSAVARGVFVSTGGFTREAEHEADRAGIPMRL